jgi:V8-like Glu-specific endopeptidase
MRGSTAGGNRAHSSPKMGRRSRVVLGLCAGLILTAASALAGAAAGHNPHLSLDSAGQSTGVLPVPDAESSKAASYWQSQLATAQGLSSTAAPVKPSATAATPNPAPAPISTTTSQPAPTTPASVPMSVSNPLSGTAFDGLPQVGAIFSTSNGSPTGHYCSGSVVDSPNGDIVVTAAHCVADTTGYVSDIAFVPDYHDGQDPYGVWAVTSIVVSPQWLDDTDPDYDVAFLTVHQTGSSARIQDVVGGDQLGIDAGYDNLVQVVGYPTDTQEPVTCTNHTVQFTDSSLTSPQLEFDCDNYPSGTSGSPFIMDVDSNTNLGTVIGVIGGYETGGDTPQVSYSVYFGDSVASLLSTAEAQS